MIIDSKYFGEIDIEEEKIIHLEQGLLGFEEYKDYVILYDSDKGNIDDNVISWFQSAQEKSIALPVVNPLHIKKDYNPTVEDELLKPLGDLGEEDYYVLVTLRVPGEVKDITANLKAPIVINPNTMQGCQVIVENEEYPIRYNVYDVVQALKEKAGD